MKATFQRSELLAAVQPAMSAVSTKNTTVAIDGIKITVKDDGTCILNSFDLDKGVRCVLHADVEESGSYIINGMKLSQMIRNMPGDITIEIDQKAQAKIYSGQSKFTINALPGEDFPNMPMLEGDWGFEMEEGQLRDMLTKTVFAVGINDPRPALNGVFFHITNDSIETVASDSFRLSIATRQLDIKKTSMEQKDLDEKVIVPAKTMLELMKMIGDTNETIRILATRKHIIFVKNNLSFFSRLIDAEYVEYRNLVPKNTRSRVIIHKDELLESLERAALVTEDKSVGQSKNFVKLNFESGVLTVSSTSVNSSIEDKIEIDPECEPLEIRFNCRYLIEALHAADCEQVELSLVSALVSIVVKPVESDETSDQKSADFLFLIVPIRPTI